MKKPFTACAAARDHRHVQNKFVVSTRHACPFLRADHAPYQYRTRQNPKTLLQKVSSDFLKHSRDRAIMPSMSCSVVTDE